MASDSDKFQNSSLMRGRNGLVFSILQWSKSWNPITRCFACIYIPIIISGWNPTIESNSRTLKMSGIYVFVYLRWSISPFFFSCFFIALFCFVLFHYFCYSFVLTGVSSSAGVEFGLVKMFKLTLGTIWNNWFLKRMDHSF